MKELLEDLGGIGLWFQPEFGKDFGFTSKLLKERPDKKEIYNLFVSEQTMDYMVKKGMASFNGYKYVEDFVKILDPDQNHCGYGSYGPGNFKMNFDFRRKTYIDPKKTLYLLRGSSGDYGFGDSFLKKVGKRARFHCQMQFVEKFQKFVQENGSI